MGKSSAARKRLSSCNPNPTTSMILKRVRLTRTALGRVAAFQQIRDGISENEAIRQLVYKGLQAAGVPALVSAPDVAGRIGPADAVAKVA